MVVGIFGAAQEGGRDLLGVETRQVDLVEPGIDGTGFRVAAEELVIVAGDEVGQILGTGEEALHDLLVAEVVDVDVVDPGVDLGLGRLAMQHIVIEASDEWTGVVVNRGKEQRRRHGQF